MKETVWERLVASDLKKCLLKNILRIECMNVCGIVFHKLVIRALTVGVENQEKYHVICHSHH